MKIVMSISSQNAAIIAEESSESDNETEPVNISRHRRSSINKDIGKTVCCQRGGGVFCRISYK